MVKALVTMPLAFAFYLLLAGSVGTEALVSAGVMAVIAAAWSAVLRANGSERRYAFGWQHSAPWWRAVAKLPADTVRVGAILTRAALAGGSPGHAANPEFRFGKTNDPDAAARRATAVAAGSLTPDTIVVDISPGSGTATCHRMQGDSAKPDPDWIA